MPTVLGWRLNGIHSKLLLLLTITGFSFSISACLADNNRDKTDFLTIVKTETFSLALYEQQGRCAIRLNDSPKGTLLNIPYPCGFVRSSPIATAQTYYYDKVGQVFVIAGPLADKSDYTINIGVNIKHKCSNQGQAVIVQENNLILRKDQNVALGFCHHLGFDEKDYYGLAYPTN